MIYYLTHIRDTIGNNYIGINMPNGIIDPYLNELKEILGDDEYEKYTDLQKDRDHGSYHITTINVMEYNAITKSMGMDKFVSSLDNIFKYEIDDLKLMGIGTATKNENRSYFIVCKSEKLEAVRSRYNLPKFDFHITLGFRYKDIFGIPKNIVIDKKSKFLKLLQIEYYKNDNWNFLKKIGNFNLDPNREVIPVSISESSIKVKSEKNYMDISLLDDDRFWIMAQYESDEDMPRLPETEISKIFNKK